jgi:hypothetical protein
MTTPLMFIGGGISLLRYRVEPTTGKVSVTCLACGATATASSNGSHHITIAHQHDCPLLDGVERSTPSRKDCPNGPR